MTALTDLNHSSALPCGCDPGLNWFCADHRFKQAALVLIDKWRERTVMLRELPTDSFVDETLTIEQCIIELEEIL